MITIREGFFKGERKDEQALPLARARDKQWVGRRDFLDNLTKIQESKKVVCEALKGKSKCRCCQEPNGNYEYSWKVGQVTFVWPEGLMHYVEVHNVRVGLAFQDFVTQVAATIK